jgi:hypothetical protein
MRDHRAEKQAAEGGSGKALTLMTLPEIEDTACGRGWPRAG